MGRRVVRHVWGRSGEGQLLDRVYGEGKLLDLCGEGQLLDKRVGGKVCC